MQGDGFYLISLTFIIIVLAAILFWFSFKIFKRSKASIKENEIFADKNFESFLNEENLKSEAIERADVMGKESENLLEVKEVEQSVNEIVKLARRYNVGQGEVELLLNLRSKKMKVEKENEYARIVAELEKGVDLRKVAKKHKIGCGEIQLFLNLKNTNHNALLKKWK